MTASKWRKAIASDYVVAAKIAETANQLRDDQELRVPDGQLMILIKNTRIFYVFDIYRDGVLDRVTQYAARRDTGVVTGFEVDETRK
jgi:hypothetical protein